MAHFHDSMRFARIETRGVMPNGKIVTSWNSYPMGVGKDVYDKLVDDMFRIYGPKGTSVVGTPMDHPSLRLETPWMFPTKEREIGENQVAVVKIIVGEDGQEDVMGVNRTIDGAATRILDEVAERLQGHGVPLSDDERAALAATIARDWSLQLDGDLVSPADIEQGRLLEIGACVSAGYMIELKDLGA